MWGIIAVPVQMPTFDSRFTQKYLIHCSLCIGFNSACAYRCAVKQFIDTPYGLHCVAAPHQKLQAEKVGYTYLSFFAKYLGYIRLNGQKVGYPDFCRKKNQLYFAPGCPPSSPYRPHRPQRDQLSHYYIHRRLTHNTTSSTTISTAQPSRCLKS